MDNIVISVGRQFGSHGLSVAKEVAQRLGCSFYDKELVELAAQKSALGSSALSGADEKATGSLLYSLAASISTYGGTVYYNMPINDRLFIAQSEIIKEKALSENCVFVGRCSDYVLKNSHIPSISAFIYADLDYRIQNVTERDGISVSKAKDKILKTEKQRRAYYDYYTTGEWGKMANYDLCLNTSALGVEMCTRIICDYAKNKFLGE